MQFDKVAAYVNANVDKGFYSDIQIVEAPGDIDVLLNKNFALPIGYEPPDLVAVDGWRQLRAEAAEQFNIMRAAAKDSGLNLHIRSAYRSHGSQVASYNIFLNRGGRASADRQSARPGHSEHQLGLALDLAHRAGTTGPLGKTGFSTSKEYYWLLEHGHEFGFIYRYQKDLIDIHGYINESWHWRYVGVDVATAMYNEGITTFEEYYGRYMAPDVIAKLTIHPTIVVIEVNRRRFEVQAFNFDGYNYIKLRDIAYIVNYTKERFNLECDPETGTIVAYKGLHYKAAGTEILNDVAPVIQPEVTELLIHIGSELYTIAGYYINDYHYFSLRDAANIFGFNVEWDDSGKVIVISSQDR
jgi:D-alanyl-D-alanine carboxypeptidase